MDASSRSLASVVSQATMDAGAGTGTGGKVDLRAPPFACRGRQLLLRAPPPPSPALKQRVKALVRAQRLSAVVAKIREHHVEQEPASHESLESETEKKSGNDALSSEEIAAMDLVRNLEMQRDTLELILKQIDEKEELSKTEKRKASKNAQVNEKEAKRFKMG